MDKNERLKLPKKIIVSVLILSVVVVIIGDGDTWTPLMTLFTSALLSGEHKLNGKYRARYKSRQKNTRSAGTRTGKVIHIKNKSKKRVSEKRGNVNVG